MRIYELTPTQIVHEARDERQFKHSWKRAAISARDFQVLEFRAIDSRPCAAFTTDDADWGERDSLANVPRAKSFPWIRAMTLGTNDGDR